MESKKTRVRYGGYCRGAFAGGAYRADVVIFRSISVTMEEVLNSLKRQGEFNKDRTLAVDLTAGSEDHVVKMKWVRPGDEKTTWESVPTIYANTPKYLS